MHPHQILNECEADAQSAFRPGKRPVALLEELKDTREQFRCDTTAIVDHTQYRGIALSVNADSNLSSGGSELHGIV